MGKIKYRGKLRRLHRTKSPYRKLNHKVFLILTWVGLIFVLAGNASAAEAPVLPSVNSSDLSAKTALEAAKPTIKPHPDLASIAKAPEAPTAVETAAAPTPSTSQDQPAREIKISITSAEYVPPAPTPTISSVTYGVSSGSNSFPYGFCTWYVASRRQVSWGGNAGSWYSNAQATGFKVGSTPAPGAIMVSYEGSAAGHVAYVESVNPDGSFRISEMDYFANGGGFGRVDYRIVVPGSVYIVGFIY